MFRALNRVFDYSGRSTRWEYWSFSIGFAVLLVACGAWVANYQNAHFGAYPPLTDDNAGGVAFGFLLFVAAPNLALRVRRYHDFGWSGWAVLWTIVPVANIVTELMLMFRGPTPALAVQNNEPEAHNINIYNSPGGMNADAVRSSGAHVDQISRLADMHAQGVLTANEFAAAKARVLRS